MSKKMILIIDDEIDMCHLIKDMLEDTGEFEVEMETLGRQAVAAARRVKPDLVLLDVMLTDIEGGEVAQIMGSDPGLKDIPVVFLTGIVSEDDINKRGGRIGGRPFIAKPTAREKLIGVIRENLKQ